MPEDTEKAMELLRGLRKEKFTLCSHDYENFLKEHKLNRSLHSLKLMFMDIESGVRKPIIPHDDTTVFILIEEITHRQQQNHTRKRRHYTQTHARPQPTAAHAPPAHTASHPIPLATDLARFHRYINTILVHKTDGEKYLQLEHHINNRRELMDKLSQLPKEGQTVLLADFNNRVFVVPCSKDEYMTKYCQDNDFYLPPGRELLTKQPTHLGLYKHSMNGIIQIDPNRRENTIERRIAFGRGKRVIKQEH